MCSLVHPRPALAGVFTVMLPVAVVAVGVQVLLEPIGTLHQGCTGPAHDQVAAGHLTDAWALSATAHKVDLRCQLCRWLNDLRLAGVTPRCIDPSDQCSNSVALPSPRERGGTLDRGVTLA